MTLPASLADAARLVLLSAAPEQKRALTQRFAEAWRSGEIGRVGSAAMPDRPARPEAPALLPPREMPRRRRNGLKGRIALLHAVAHIELNAIDLAWDIIGRFTNEALPRAFYDDWVAVAADEARHFGLLSGRLGALGAAYGDLPAHDGLWRSAQQTAHDLLARLAVVPLLLEARGLDVTPGMAASLRAAGDVESAAVLDVIYAEEIGHVAAGRRWFEALCTARGLDPEATFRDLVRRHHGAPPKPPFNREARARAGLASTFYEHDAA
ncbi:MAG: ferritin-like domain-containing protein [Alphaproteobacteria bacterium]